MPDGKAQKKHTEAQRLAKQAKRRAKKQRRRGQQQASGMQHVRAQQHAVFSSLIAEQEGLALARQMALPEGPNASLLRVPTVDMPPVAVNCSQWTATLTASAATLDLAGYPVKPSELMVINYGQPGRAALVGPLVTVAAEGAVTTTFRYAQLGGAGLTASVVLAKDFDTLDPGSTHVFQWDPVQVIDSVVPASGPKRRPLGHSRGRTFVYIDPNEQFLLTHKMGGTVIAPTYNLRVVLYQWGGPHEPHTSVMEWHSSPTGEAAGIFAVTTSGWYTMDIFASLPDNVTVDVEVTLEVAIAAKVANPARMIHYWNETLTGAEIGDSCRRTCYTLLMTNTTAQMYRSGTVVAGRMLNERFGNYSLSETASGYISSSSVALLNSKYTGQAAKGCFTYMDFDQEAEKFATAVNNWGNPICDLDYRGFVNLEVFSQLTLGAEVVASYLATFTMVTEFRTDNMMFAPTVSSLAHDALVEARRVNNTTPYFYENPLHMGDIWNNIKKGFAAFRKVAIPLGMAASTFFPEAGGVIMPIAHAIQS